MPTKDDLEYFQALPLDMKVALTKARLREWVSYFGLDNVFVSFSGGKDSTTLLHIAREIYPDIKAVFADTGLEYPEIREFVKTFDNVEVVRPKTTFRQVITDYGYPIISKEVATAIYESKIGRRTGGYRAAIEHMEGIGRFAPKDGQRSRYDFSKYKPLLDVDFNISHKCCDIIKKKPMNRKEKPIVATLAEESMLRTESWLRFGCNAFESKHQVSKPMSFWQEQDVLRYIKENNIKIASVYGDIIEKDGQLSFFDDYQLCTTGCKRTGCVFCAFGSHLGRGESRFQMLKRTHPRLYNYCIGGGAYNESGIWIPDKNGLGMGHVFDVCNEIYGRDFLRYK